MILGNIIIYRNEVIHNFGDFYESLEAKLLVKCENV